MKVYNNKNIKIGDIVKLVSEYSPDGGFKKGDLFKVYAIDTEGYLHLSSLYYTAPKIVFHLTSVNAQLFELATREMRERRLKKLLKEC